VARGLEDPARKTRAAPRGRARWDENERNKKRACVISGKSVKSSLRSGQKTHPGRVKFRDIHVNFWLFVEIQAKELEMPAKELEMPAKELEMPAKELEMLSKEREMPAKELETFQKNWESQQKNGEFQQKN
jgi:hypothetical protein